MEGRRSAWSAAYRAGGFLPPESPRSHGSRMIYPVRDLPGPLLADVAEAIDISGIRFRYWICLTSQAMEDPAQMMPEYQSWPPRSRGVGRPSVVAPRTPQLTGWLREDPDTSRADIRRRAPRAGYRGGNPARSERAGRPGRLAGRRQLRT